MDLHKMIRAYVVKRGPEVVKSNELTNHLDDEHAFNEFDTKPYKKILRIIINSGYAERLLALGGYSSEVKCLAVSLAQQELLEQTSVCYLFDCLAYGLGWIHDDPIKPESEIKVEVPEGKGKEAEKTKVEISGSGTISSVSSQNSIVKKNGNKSVVIVVSLVILLLLGSVLLLKHFDVDDVAIETSSFPNALMNNLDGNYTLWEYRNGERRGATKTATLKKVTYGYMFTILTEYGAENHVFEKISDNKVHSETLGDGVVTYKELINKITITFNKENYTWEFVK